MTDGRLREALAVLLALVVGVVIFLVRAEPDDGG